MMSQHRLLSLLTRLRKHAYSRVAYIYYRLDVQATAAGADSHIVEIDRYDVLLAPPTDPASARHADGFAARAKSRRHPGSYLYTIARDGELAHWGWRIDFNHSHRLVSVRDTLQVERMSTILVEFYTEAAHRRQGLYEENLRKMLYDGAEEGVRDAYIATRVDNGASRRVIERVGFKPFRIYTKTRLLGRTKVRDAVPGDYFAPLSRAAEPTFTGSTPRD